MLNIEEAFIETIFFILAGIVLLAFSIVSVVLYHHWTAYGVGKKQVKRLRTVYFGVSAVWIALMAAGTLTILLS